MTCIGKCKCKTCSLADQIGTEYADACRERKMNPKDLSVFAAFMFGHLARLYENSDSFARIILEMNGDDLDDAIDRTLTDKKNQREPN